jgi:hypothetical protein
MNNQINDGGPAFPTQATATTTRTDTAQPVQTHYGSTPGMTLRDYFAAAALQGLMATPNGPRLVKEAVATAYHAADAMLKAREAKP